MRNRSMRSRGSEHFPKGHRVHSTWPYSQPCPPAPTPLSTMTPIHPEGQDVIHIIIPFSLVAALFSFDSKQQQPLGATLTARCLTELYLARQLGVLSGWVGQGPHVSTPHAESDPKRTLASLAHGQG